MLQGHVGRALCICILWHAALATSRLPHWPGTFMASFWSPGKRTKGVLAFGQDSAGHAAEVIDLLDGSHDHLCSRFHNNTPCLILTADEWKWLAWPELKKCCKCCSFGNGCGPLASTWLTNSSGNIFYEGKSTVVTPSGGLLCHKWKVIGLDPEHPNYYFEHTGENGTEGMPCEIDGYNYLFAPAQRADDQYIFDPRTYWPSPDSQVFQVPSFCAADSYCEGQVCDAPPDIATVSV
mmetsp:Transcript_46415/g.110585  ORF Transcript_46415/g.110585 Transcript_46415/m.110585 type:complete len:236 (-) Transcript_46415:72-779(-)